MTDAPQPRQVMKGYLCHCVSYMPEVSVYLEGTDEGVCRMMMMRYLDDISTYRIPPSDIRVMRYDESIMRKPPELHDE